MTVPREKLAKLGAKGLSNAELIAIILRSGSHSMPLATICKSLIDAIGDNVSNLAALDVEQITKVKGIGEIKAITLLAAIELGKAKSTARDQPLRLKNEADIESLIKRLFDRRRTAWRSIIWCCLNNRSELLSHQQAR